MYITSLSRSKLSSVSGQIVHITEDGIEKHLAVGDVAVQKEPCMRGKIRPHHRGPG